MSSGRFAPAVVSSSQIATKFGKSAHAKRADDHQVVAIRFSPMHPHATDPERGPPKAANGTLTASRPTNANGHLLRPELGHKPGYSKSTVFKLIGSFLVGVVCLSLVAAAVMIRTDSSRDQARKAATSITAVTASPVNKRSASHTSAAPDSQASEDSLHRAGLQMLNSDVSLSGVGLVPNDSLNVPVPIRVVIDPQLIAPRATFQPEVQSTNVHVKQSDEAPTSDTGQLRANKRALVEATNRYVIEMDIKVKKSN